MNDHPRQTSNKLPAQPSAEPAEQVNNTQTEAPQKKCINCHRLLVKKNNAWLCPQCNPDSHELDDIFIDPTDENEYIFIECPGATLYEPGTDKVIAGVKFLDDNEPSAGFEIIREPIYAPTHTRRRRIRKDARGKIRRCQGCQDYTVRMRRKEGPDFFIPSPKHPRRKKLKSVTPQNTP